MEWILAALAIAVIGLAAAAANGRFGDLPDVVDDRVHPTLPETGPVSAADLRDVQFAVVPRGYSMEQVDALLDRLATQLDAAPTAAPVAADPGAPDLE
ncbi:MAG TPA: DivIVA domain-containing protein [Propionibacteriaceae bacterium]|nr:DivIVA domain-containing protein [Propionibacteriaceae bacterium]